MQTYIKTNVMLNRINKYLY